MWARLSLVAALLSMSAHASEPLLTSSLGRWLDQTATPHLAETLSKHPMFKGETIRLVSLRDGKPVESSNRLSEAVQERLTRQLLRKEGVRIAWSHSRKACEVPKPIHFLLGVEIEYEGSQQYRLNIAMVDVDEAVWVSGINLTWNGRLTSAERRAMREEVSTAAPGSFERPLPVTRVDEVTYILSTKLSCTHPNGIEGPIFFPSQPNADLVRVKRGLETELSMSPLADVTTVEESADWLMRLHAEPMGDDVFELALTLEDPAPPARAQQAASVFVTGIRELRESDVNDLPATLVGAIDELGACRDAPRGSRCVELGLTLERPAYLLTFHTHDGELGYPACGHPIELSPAGERRYRLRVPKRAGGPTGHDVGFYALATESRSLARAVERRLTEAPGACGYRHASLDTWLVQLQQILDAYPGELDWRAVHFKNTPTGLAGI
jgi:hypothetical protein